MTAQVMMSYAHEDEDIVKKLAEALKQANVPVWIDQPNIPIGAEWEKSIEQALRSCTHVIVVLTPTSVDRPYVKREYTMAAQLGKIVLPIKYKECKIPLLLEPIQYVDFTNQDFDTALQGVVQQFRKTLNNQPPTSSASNPQWKDGKQTAAEPKLALSRQNRWVLGVCGGLAENWHTNPLYVRIGFIVALIFGLLAGGVGVFVPILIYVVLWLTMK